MENWDFTNTGSDVVLVLAIPSDRLICSKDQRPIFGLWVWPTSWKTTAILYNLWRDTTSAMVAVHLFHFRAAWLLKKFMWLDTMLNHCKNNYVNSIFWSNRSTSNWIAVTNTNSESELDHLFYNVLFLLSRSKWCVNHSSHTVWHPPHQCYWGTDP